MLRMFFSLVLLSVFLAAVNPTVLAAPPSPAFGVAAHDDVNIEWWYVNAHVTTEKGRHLALIGSFFRFGNGKSPLDNTTPLPRAHYLIYAVTDLDKKTQRAYSLPDANMVSLFKTLGVLPPSGRLPAPHREISGAASVISAPFHLAYGAQNTLAATDAADTSFALTLDAGGPDKITLSLSARKPPMAVGGKGETGLRTPTDMYYFSLTRCAVGGTIDTGMGPEKIVSGQGWFDHQWGNSWGLQNDGWDWWGVQLDDGMDVLFFRQRDLATGRIFSPLATFMDKNGHQSVTTRINFTSDPKSLWKSQKSGVRYPLAWTVTFPEKKLRLQITAAVQNQEMPILGPGGGIWEGSCHVLATRPRNVQTAGVAYMELVGYSSPIVKKQFVKKQFVKKQFAKK